MTSMRNVQELFEDNSTKNELTVMLFSSQCNTETIIQLEKSGINLRESIALVQNIENKLSKRETGVEFAVLNYHKFYQKFQDILELKPFKGY